LDVHVGPTDRIDRVVDFSGGLFCYDSEPPVDALIKIKVTGVNNFNNFEYVYSTDDDGGFYLGSERLPFGTYKAQAFYAGDPSAGAEPSESRGVEFDIYPYLTASPP
jgi:hypothetical protein